MNGLHAEKGRSQAGFVALEESFKTFENLRC